MFNTGFIDHFDIVGVPSDIMYHDIIDEVLQVVFEDFRGNIDNPGYFTPRFILFTTNKIVDEVNNEIIGQLTGEIYTFTSVATISSYYG